MESATLARTSKFATGPHHQTVGLKTSVEIKRRPCKPVAHRRGTPNASPRFERHQYCTGHRREVGDYYAVARLQRSCPRRKDEKIAMDNQSTEQRCVTWNISAAPRTSGKE